MTKLRTLLLSTMLPAVLLIGLCYLCGAKALPASASTLLRSPAAPVSDDGDEDARSRFRGVIVSRPDDGLGEWVIVAGNGVTRTVTVVRATRLDDGILSPGDWARVEGSRLNDGTLQATRIRLDDQETGEIVVRLVSDVLSTTVASRYDLTAGSTVLASGHIYLLNTPSEDDEIDELLEELLDDPDVLWAEPNYVGRVPEGDPYKTWRWGGQDPKNFVNQAAFEQVNLEPALAHYQGQGVVVAILDTGIDLKHPKLAGRWLEGYDMIDDDANPQEEGPGVGWGHGTHVAGIIAHIAPQSKLLPIRVLDAEGRGNTFTLAYAIEWAVKRGAKIINLSLGTTFDSRVLSQVIEEAVDQGVIIVAAAGNNNQPNRQYPVGYPDVIGVTAVDSRNHKASFANYGVWIDFAAPGVGITSTIIGAQGSGYASWSGTSMSTAFLSGALTLAREKWPTRTPDELLQALQEGGGDLNSSNPTHAGKLGRMLNISAPLVADLPSTETPTQTPDFTPTVTPTPTVTEQPVETGTPEATITPTPSSTAPPATPSPTEPPSTNLTNRVYLPITLR